MFCYDFKVNPVLLRLKSTTFLVLLYVCYQVGVIAELVHASEEPGQIIISDFTSMIPGSAEQKVKAAGVAIHRINPVGDQEVESDATLDLIFSSASKNEDQPFKNKSIPKSITRKPIVLKWQEKKLGEILEEVELSSGIKFKVSPKVKSESITTSIFASNWSDAVRKLLKGYSIMEVTNGKGELVKVLIMSDTVQDRSISKKGGSSDHYSNRGNGSQQNRTSNRLDPDNLSRMKKKLRLSRSVSKALYANLKKIESWPAEKNLPSSMYSDSDLQDFLSLNGIESSEDMSDTGKISRLKRAARKQMLIMKKRARASDIDLE